MVGVTERASEAFEEIASHFSRPLLDSQTPHDKERAIGLKLRTMLEGKPRSHSHSPTLGRNNLPS
ncbi:hypothetical protein MPTK2_8g14690 [Marchantia polymorpha subsp. ruderalis]